MRNPGQHWIIAAALLSLLIGAAVAGVERPREHVPESVFHRALRGLTTEDAPEGVRVSDAQRERLATIDRERAEALRAFMLAHAGELRELRSEVAKARQSGDEEAAARLMARLGEIERARPNADEHQDRVWAVLNDAQRALMRDAIVEAAYDALHRRMLARLDSLRARAEPPTRANGPRDGAPRLTDAQFEAVRDALRAPTTEAERTMGSVERARTRVMALPDAAMPRTQREALTKRLLEGEAGA